MIKYKLEDISLVVGGGTPPTTNERNYDGDIVWITPKDLSDQNEKFIERGQRSITLEGFNACSAQMIPPYNILMSSRAPIGLLAINRYECCTNQGFKSLILNKDICDVDYVYYYLKHHIREIESLGSGTTFKEVSKKALQSFEFSLPELEVQLKISKLLSDIDAKITLNRSINHNLEAMAKQLYDYWFVQFDFPDENGKPYKSSGGKMVWNEKLKREIPEEWKVKSIFEAISVQYGFPFSTEQFTEEITNVQVVRIRDILEGTTSAYSLEDTDEKYRLNEGDVLVGMDGNFHMNFWHNNEAYLNQRCVRLRPYSDSGISSIQILHSISPYIKAKEQSAKGSTVGHLSDKDLKGLCLVQSINTMHFNSRKTLDGLLSLIIRNKKEVLSLTKLRDSLLPLLMNGQVSINYDLSNDWFLSSRKFLLYMM